MRPPLEQIASIEAYLEKTMNASDRQQFEQEMAKDKDLSNMVEQQRMLTDAIRRKALRAEIKNAGNAGGSGGSGFSGNIPLIIGGIVAAIAFTTALFLLDPFGPTENQVLKEDAEVFDIKRNHVDFNGLHMWMEPEVQTETFQAEEGSTVEGEDGTLIIIPDHAFLDSLGNPVEGNVELELIEALTLDKMVLYNLSTVSGSQALETGGMVYLNATQNGNDLQVNPDRAPLVQIPTEEVNPDMMLFKGVAQEDGSLDWQDPKPLEKMLFPVPFEELDFLPSGFADTLATLDKSSMYHMSKPRLVDSVYYTLSDPKSSYVPPLPQQRSRTVPIDQSPSVSSMPFSQNEAAVLTEQTDLPAAIPSGGNPIVSRNTPASNEPNSFFTEEPGATDSTTGDIASTMTCGIDPLSIKSIRTEHFAKTFIATKAFEERIHTLHSVDRGDHMLDQYIQRIKEPMYKIDAWVAQRLRGEDRKAFEQFAEQRYTNVEGIALYADRLNAYYAKKKLEFRKALNEDRDRAAEADRNNLEAKLDKATKRYEAARKALKAMNKNMVVVKPEPRILSQPNVATQQAYTFQWNAPGWSNIDCYLPLVQEDPLVLTISVDSAYGKPIVYQWLNTISTLTPLRMTKNTGQAAFPALGREGSQAMQNTYALSISRDGDRFWWGMQNFNPYESEGVHISMKERQLEDIKAELKSLSKSSGVLADRLRTMKEELEFRLSQLRKQDKSRVQYRQAVQRARNKYQDEQMKILAEAQERANQNNKDLKRLLEVARPCLISTIISSDGALDILLNEDAEEFEGSLDALLEDTPKAKID